MQRINLTNKSLEEIQKIKEDCPDGHIETKGDKTYWVFECGVEYGV